MALIDMLDCPYSNDMILKWPDIALMNGMDSWNSSDRQIDSIHSKAIDFMRKMSENPFFVYFPFAMTMCPFSRIGLSGQSGGLYGDVIGDDWAVGEILTYLKQNGCRKYAVFGTSDMDL